MNYEITSNNKTGGVIMKSNIENKILKVVQVIVKSEVERNSNKWPPTCMGILHQPKRPCGKK